jgi:hypothetical protein
MKAPEEWGPAYAGWFVLKSKPHRTDGNGVSWTLHTLEHRGASITRKRGVCASGDVPGLVVPSEGPAPAGYDLSFLGGRPAFFK